MKTGYGGAQVADINKDGYLDLMAGGHIVDLDNPEKHGFPLRVVAEGYYGDDWVKYVYKMTLEEE